MNRDHLYVWCMRPSIRVCVCASVYVCVFKEEESAYTGTLPNLQLILNTDTEHACSAGERERKRKEWGGDECLCVCVCVCVRRVISG